MNLVLLKTYKDIEGAMFFVLFSKLNYMVNTVYISEKSEWIVFPWKTLLIFKTI